jgi:RNA polymerase sigma factor (sigma-70 family)
VNDIRRPLTHSWGRFTDRQAGAAELGAVDVTVMRAYPTLEEACSQEFPRLVRLLTLYCGERDIAMDLAQEALARGCAHWQRVKNMTDQRAWFTRVALNLANSSWRRKIGERRALRTLDPDSSCAPESDLASAIAVRIAVSRLPRQQRTAVVLRFFEDLDVTTAAQVMGCGEGTVKKLTARGLVALRSMLSFDDPAGVDHV